MLVLDARAVRALLPPKLAYTVVEEAFHTLRDEATYQPVRAVFSPPSIDGTTLVKPAAVNGAYGMKVVSIFPKNPRRGLDAIQGFVVLLDADTGVAHALLDGAAVTEIRTAAASALATHLLARADASRLGILGAGVQARSHLLALREVRQLEQVTVWSPRSGPAFAAWAREQHVEVVVASTPKEAVCGCDLVCTVTASPTPVLRGEWLAPGTHINAVGAFRPGERELDTEAVVRSTVVVDMRESAAADAGVILLAQEEGAVGPDHVVAELTDVLLGAHPGRTSNDEITLFSSTGLAVQDIATARATIAAARAAGAGVEVVFP